MSNLNEPRKHVGASWNWLPPKFEQAPAPKTREQVGAASQRALAAKVSANQNRAKQYRVSKFWKFNSSNPQVGDWTWSIKNIATGWVVATRKTRKQAEAYAALKNGGSK